MLHSSRILVTALVLCVSGASLSACGQQGPLFLPTEPAAVNRATLPQTLFPQSPLSTPTPVSPVTTANPAASAASGSTQ